MKYNPNTIAQDLIKDLGLEDAMQAVSDGISDAHIHRDNYHLSIWRDVRRILNDQLPTD